MLAQHFAVADRTSGATVRLPVGGFSGPWNPVPPCPLSPETISAIRATLDDESNRPRPVYQVHLVIQPATIAERSAAADENSHPAT